MGYLGYRARAPLRPVPAPPGRLETARAVPEGSRQLRGRHAAQLWVAGLKLLPQFHGKRPQRQRTVLAFAAELADKASHEDATSYHSRAARCEAADRSVSSWKAAYRDLHAWGCIGKVREGRIYRHGDQVRHDAAVYVLCLPKHVLRKMADDRRRVSPSPQTRPPTVSAEGTPSEPTRDPCGYGPPSGRAQPGGRRPRQGRCARLATAGGAASGSVADVVRKWTGQGITDGWIGYLVRDFLAAGWTARDLDEAMAGPPAGQLHRYLLSTVRDPRRWLEWRLGHWRGRDGHPVASPSQTRAEIATRNRIRQADTRHAAEKLQSRFDPGPLIAQLRAQLDQITRERRRPP